ncbi:MAG: PP2C family protein-serine/threonine phosphatase [Capsulimonas sp.]|uniref:PP2C family protein-serine/threonine phosphatase n=1 Tax=Capsulimonas sp. TaxID=2494211 RepID=UPI003265FA01
MTSRQSMIEHSPLAMATTEGPAHTLLSVNSAFCALHEKQAGEIIGRPVSETISGTGSDSILALLDRVYREEKSGSIRPSYDSGSIPKSQAYMAWSLPLTSSSSEGLVLLVTDFAEKTLADKLLERATAEILTLNSEMREMNEQLLISAVEQHTLSDRNRDIAEALQYSLLWPQPEKSFGSLKAAVFYEPAMDDAMVGGDFFDAFPLHNNSIMLVVGDVTGKGLRAAARTVEIRFALRAFSQQHNDPASMITCLNEFICDFHYDDDDPLDNALVVLSVVVIDPVTGRAQAASAGAEPPLILRASGGMEEITVHGLILGINHDATYVNTDFVLEEGGTLIMTTDGLTEARSGNDFFGSQGLLAAAGAMGGARTLHDMVKMMVDAARAHGRGKFMDDVCLLLARRDRIAPVDAA